MKNRMRPGGFLSAAGMFFLYLAFLLVMLHIVGTDAGLYYRLQMRAEILPEAGISAEELKSADEALAKYLRGDAAALNDSPFGAVEIAHMRDCFDLFVLLREVTTGCAVAALLCLLVGKCANVRRGAVWAAGVMAVFLAALALWGIFDFDSLFTAFHRLLFTNELWLLNPETDLLIRICPESMFAAMAALIGGAEVLFIGFCIWMVGAYRHD